MPGETYTLGEILADLEERMEETIDAELAADDPDEEAAYQSRGQTLEQRAYAFADLADEFGDDAELHVADLSVQERIDFGEIFAAARQQWAEREGVEPEGGDLRDVFWVAACVDEAPWLTGEDSMADRAAALRADGPPNWHAILHLVELATEVNSLESGNVKSYAERRAERAQTNEPT